MLEEGAPVETQPSTRAGSPVSQSGIDPMEALSASFGEGLLHASKQNMEQPGSGRLSPPLQPRGQPPSSPYHRLWERWPQQSVQAPVSQYGFPPPPPQIQTSYPVHPAPRPASMLLRSPSMNTVSQPPHITYSTSALAATQQYPTQLSFNCPPELTQATGHQPYNPNPPSQKTKEDPDRDQVLYDFLGRMLSELQIMKDQVVFTSPNIPQPVMVQQTANTPYGYPHQPAVKPQPPPDPHTSKPYDTWYPQPQVLRHLRELHKHILLHSKGHTME